MNAHKERGCVISDIAPFSVILNGFDEFNELHILESLNKNLKNTAVAVCGLRPTV